MKLLLFNLTRLYIKLPGYSGPHGIDNFNVKNSDICLSSFFGYSNHIDIKFESKHKLKTFSKIIDQTAFWYIKDIDENKPIWYCYSSSIDKKTFVDSEEFSIDEFNIIRSSQPLFFMQVLGDLIDVQVSEEEYFYYLLQGNKPLFNIKE